jgi:hypothetical protein
MEIRTSMSSCTVARVGLQKHKICVFIHNHTHTHDTHMHSHTCAYPYLQMLLQEGVARVPIHAVVVSDAGLLPLDGVRELNLLNR